MDEINGFTNARQETRRYEIRLKGHLETRWAAWFDGMSITHASDGTTILTGRIADQAALHGLLQKLRDLGVPLTSVTELDPATEPPQPHESRTTRERRTR